MVRWLCKPQRRGRRRNFIFPVWEQTGFWASVFCRHRKAMWASWNSRPYRTFIHLFKVYRTGTSLGQWQRFQAPGAGYLGSIPAQGTRSHTQQPRVCRPQPKILNAARHSGHPADTWNSWINKYIFFKLFKKTLQDKFRDGRDIVGQCPGCCKLHHDRLGRHKGSTLTSPPKELSSVCLTGQN